MSEPLWQPRSDRSARLAGAAFFLGGTGLVALQLNALRHAAEQGSDALIFGAAIGLGEMGMIMGLFWVVRGLAGYTATRRLQHDARGRRLLMIASAVLIGLTLLALHFWLRAQGYET